MQPQPDAAGWGAAPWAPATTAMPGGPIPEGRGGSAAPDTTAAAQAARVRIPWLGLVAVAVFLAGAAAATMPWVSGQSPEADGTVGTVLDLAGFEDGETVVYEGLDIPGVGSTAAAVAIVGAALAVAGLVLRRPVIFLSTSGAAGAVAALAAVVIVLLAWLEIDNIPFSSYIPADVREQIPNPEVERGLWVYLLCAAAGGVVCAVCAVTCHRRRYGIGPRPPVA